MALVTMDAKDFVKRKQEIQLHINLQTEISGDYITEQWEQRTFPYVPRKDGYLEGGYKRQVKSQAPRLLIEAKYSALSNSGFDYALIQHDRKFNHPIKGEDKYFEKGIKEVDVMQIWASRLRNIIG